MSSAVCPGCGAGLETGARFCAKCGQPLAAPGSPATHVAPASAGAGRKLPVVPLAIFGGGLIVLVGVLTMMRSSSSRGPAGSSPAPALPAAVPASAGPAPTSTSAPPAAAAAGEPASTSALSFPESLPPPAPGAASSGGPAAAAASASGGPRAPSTRVWKDPLDTAGEPAAPPPSAPVRRPAAPPPAHPAPAVEKAPPIAKTYECREAAVFSVDPEETVLTVDGHRIGTADQWDDRGRNGKKYEFKGAGVHIVKLSLEDYETLWLKFIVSDDAKNHTADVELNMKRKHR